VSVSARLHLRCLLTACLFCTAMQVRVLERPAVRYTSPTAGAGDCTGPTVSHLFEFCRAARVYGLVGVCLCVSC
jgi:hypothetical protein